MYIHFIKIWQTRTTHRFSVSYFVELCCRFVVLSFCRIFVAFLSHFCHIFVTFLSRFCRTFHTHCRIFSQPSERLNSLRNFRYMCTSTLNMTMYFLSRSCRILVAFLSRFCRVFVAFLSRFCHLSYICRLCRLFVVFLIRITLWTDRYSNKIVSTYY
jgi:hypothetical protein